MLLDANSPPADPPPASLSDRPAHIDAAPQHRDDTQPSNDRSNDATQASSQDNGDTKNVHDTKSSDTAEKKPDTVKDSDENDTGKGQEDSSNTDDSGDSQKTADGSTCAQLVSPLTIVIPATVPATASTASAPDDSEKASCAAPAMSPASAFVPANPVAVTPDDTAPQTTQPTTKKSAGDLQIADVPAPVEPTAQNAPAAPKLFTGKATPALASTGTSTSGITPTDSVDDNDGDASTDPVGNTGPVAQNAPADLKAKMTAPHHTDSTAAVEPATPENIEMPAPPVTPTPETSTAQPTKKTALPAASTNTDAQTAIKLPDEPLPVKVDVSGTNGKPANANSNANAGTHEPTTKTDGPKSDSAKIEAELENDRPHHLTSEHALSTEINSVPTSRIGTPGSVTIGADTASTLGVTMPTTQAPATIVAANTPAMPAAAIPLAALPIEIATQAKDGKNRFEIRLDPPELGRIDVRLDIDNKGIVTSRLMAERPETLDLLRRDAPQIERALQDAGLKTSDQGLQFSLRDQSFADRSHNAPPTAAPLALPEDDTMPLEAVRQGYGRLFGLGGGIDIRV